MSIAWTKEEYEHLRELALAGHTAKQAMQLLNEKFGNDRTRNAIIGASHRIHVTMGRGNSVVVRAVAARAARKARPRRKLKFILLPEKSMSEPEQIIVKPPKSEPPWSVSDLTSCTCRWIDGDPRAERPFACPQEKAFEKPYCATHLKRAFGPSHKGRMVV